MVATDCFDIIVIGGGHAGAEAAWAAANLGARTALVTMDPEKIGAMSCNPAIGGLAKGQIVREIDALGGLMGRAIDATGIQFRMLNISKGPAVRGPRAQADKYRYAKEVQRLLATRQLVSVLRGTVEEILVDQGRVVGVSFCPLVADHTQPKVATRPCNHSGMKKIRAASVVLTTGTFMRGLMHTGEQKNEGGRVGEMAAVGISAALGKMGFELGRLKTGTPPRLDALSIDFDCLEVQPGDKKPEPFSDLTDVNRFPISEQRVCHITYTNDQVHELIRQNLHRAPMYNGQIQTSGPRYCPSIEDKVVRFADRSAHHVYLEPESLDSQEIYCNGISTSLPSDVQEQMVRKMPGCRQAKILRYGYAVEYDMVWPHQIDATCMTKLVEGLFLAGQINGTSGYEEAAGQGVVAGLNAVRYAKNQSLVRLGRDQAYIGVMLDDLVTKTPQEPYRMFTSRAEHRLLLRADNADQRLTELGRQWGLIGDRRWQRFQHRARSMATIEHHVATQQWDGQLIRDWIRRPGVNTDTVVERLQEGPLTESVIDRQLIARLVADIQYAGYIKRQNHQVKLMASQEKSPLPNHFDYQRVQGLRNEARQTLTRFRPGTLGQAGRLAGVTPADLMVLAVALRS